MLRKAVPDNGNEEVAMAPKVIERKGEPKVAPPKAWPPGKPPGGKLPEKSEKSDSDSKDE